MAILLEKRNLRGLIIDCIESESHGVNNTSTDNPIAGDSPVQDHATTQPRKITIVGTISDAPPHLDLYYTDDYRPRNIESAPLLEDLSEGANVETFKKTIGVENFGSADTSFNSDIPGDRIKAAWKRFLEIARNKEIVQLVTNLEIYDNLIIESVRADQNGGNSNRIEFTAVLKQIRRVSPKASQITQIQKAGSKGSEDVGDVKLTCLQIKDVFTSSSGVIGDGSTDQSVVNPVFREIERLDNGDIKVIDSSSNVIENNGELYTPFTYSVWNSKVCRYLEDRVSNQFIGSSQLQSIEVDRSTDICSSIYDLEIPCNSAITTRCGDRQFNGDNPNAPVDIDLDSKTDVVDVPLNTNQIASLLPQTQIYNPVRAVDPNEEILNRTAQDANQSVSLQTRYNSETNRQVYKSRLSCYYAEVLKIYEARRQQISDAAQSRLPF